MYNPYSLKGKTILITGASGGIGRQTALECAKLGAKCVITGRNESRLMETYNQLEGRHHNLVVADISLQQGIDALVQTVPNIDGIVNNAGVGITKTMAFYKQTDLESVFQTNTFAPMLIIKTLLKQKKICSGASIVLISSVASVCSQYGNGIYGASKAAIEAYMRYCAKELASRGIRVNSIHPGMVETGFIHDGVLSQIDLNNDIKNYPLGRYGTPKDIALASTFLLSEASSWITGISLFVDGGFTLK